MANSREHDGEAIVAGRPPGAPAVWAVLVVSFAVVGGLIAAFVGRLWPLLAAGAVLVVSAAPSAMNGWRYRHDFAALRRARRRARRPHENLKELRNMYGSSTKALTRVVHGVCEVADTTGTALLIESDDDDPMMATWTAEGFVEVERVDTHWGTVVLLSRTPASATAPPQRTR